MRLWLLPSRPARSSVDVREGQGKEWYGSGAGFAVEVDADDAVFVCFGEDLFRELVVVSCHVGLVVNLC